MTETLAEKTCALPVVASHHSLMRKPNASVRRPRTGNSATTLIVSSGPSGSATFAKQGPLSKRSVNSWAEGHHPDISFGWGYATVGLQTKKIKGLHENDFIIATKIDQIFDRSTKNPSR